MTPRTLKQMMRQAEKAMEEKDWESAAAHWRALFDDYPDDVPLKAYRHYARALRKAGRPDEAESLIQKAMAVFKDDPKIHKEFVEAAFHREDWPNAVQRCHDAASLFDIKTPLRIFQRLDMACQYLPPKGIWDRLQKWFSAGRYSRKRAARAFQPTWGRHAEEYRKCCSELEAGNTASAIELFETMARCFFDNGPAADIWTDAFCRIGSLFDDTRTTRQHIRSDHAHPGFRRESRNTRAPACRKIIVSGMGWSGSGALFDYFREFDEVHPIKGEFRLLEGKSSVKTLLKKTHKPDDFRLELLRFFGMTLLGVDQYTNYSECKASLLARKLALSNNRVAYAEGVHDFCDRIAGVFENGRFDRTCFKSAVSGLVDTIAAIKGAKQNQMILFDNIIHINNLSLIDYMDNTLLFCTFRDPRSNYVAQVNENPRFKKGIERFIWAYRTKRSMGKGAYDSLETNRASVCFVRFEDFVLSEKYRDELAEKAGLDLQKREKHRFFRPWVSEKNVHNYKDFSDHEAIAKIESRLREYCVNDV